MVEQARAIRAKLESGSRERLNRIAKSLASTLGREVLPEEAADVVAQAAACAGPILAAAGDAREGISWLREQLADWERAAIERAEALSTEYSVLRTWEGGTADVAHLYEDFLQRYAAVGRKRGGVFFTPQPIADCIVRRVDRLLCEDFSLTAGLADEAVAILDPACGTGVFLLSVIEHLQDRGDIANVLSRLIGVEILPAAALLAKLNVAIKQAAVGCDFQRCDCARIITGDALSPNLQSKIQNPKSNIPIVLGNPPFSSLSTTTNEWIARLVRGDDEVRGYVRANGQRLNERKTWLHDDYVKFIRLAQWHVEQAGRGIVGYVTNHGFLDNATFRLMRQELLRVFPRIEIIDLHGNRKKHEIAPDGRRDENVFGLDQGVAISVFAKGTGDGGQGTGDKSRVGYAELWGSRALKLRAIARDPFTQTTDFSPQPLDWRLIPSPRRARRPEYEAGWSLAEAMPVSTTAPVTARDHFVVAFTGEELRSRICEFRDLSISDEEIRRRYFQRTRSARYQPGDTRGWKLSEARRIVAADTDWPEKIVRCLYRPFDWRYVFWHPAMVDWPRTEITRHLVGIESRMTNDQAPMTKQIQNPKSKFQNLCLLARRQQLPTQPCTFFWISDGLALDGVIRSDNRGSESLFPLYLQGGQANFAQAFSEQVAATTGLSWLQGGDGDLVSSFGPEDLMAYVYALFHSPSYRERYADDLRSDFPRVLVPRRQDLFSTMARLGIELIQLHLLRMTGQVLSTGYLIVSKAGKNGPQPDRFRAGGYFALRKWLQPKRRTASDPEYTRIAAAISRTIEIMSQIDAAVEGSGGWDAVFSAKAD
jgi:predicted helicase